VNRDHPARPASEIDDRALHERLLILLVAAAAHLGRAEVISRYTAHVDVRDVWIRTERERGELTEGLEFGRLTGTMKMKAPRDPRRLVHIDRLNPVAHIAVNPVIVSVISSLVEITPPELSINSGRMTIGASTLGASLQRA
jgi:hypothetical protein